MRRIGFLLPCLLAGCGGNEGPIAAPRAGPAVADPVLATLAGGPVRVTGRGFGVFATKIWADHRTTMSMCGEDILVDPRGRVWFAQGGLKAGARLWSFDPERVASDPTFDFTTSLDALVNPADPATGFRAYDLPLKDDQPAHLAMDPDGSIWYSAYWRNRIGRLVPETGVVQEIPLPKAIGKSPPTAIVGGGPWSLHVAPDGTVVFNEFSDSTLTRIDAARVRAGDPACFALDKEGRNPCILDSLVVPEADLVSEQVHSTAYDREGRLWYTIHGPNEAAAPGGRASLGFVTADWKRIVRLPPLPRAAGEGALSANGIAIDPKNGDIWFAEYWSPRLGRLRRE
ncbi:MAG: hypothetical protein HYY18_00415 [Planctomycetes bacterium]|nr:hypothetical protein [Planctomycetota bacterium]